MFTGLIEETGTLRSIRDGRGMRTLDIGSVLVAPELAPGDSVSVNGVCLTMTESGRDWFRVQAVGASLEKTAIPYLRAGAALNLERALRADSRLDGHIVQGHVAATGLVLGWQSDGEARSLHLAVDGRVMDEVRDEGSIAIDGVSLTVAGTGASPGEAGARGSGGRIRLSVIPHTLSSTNLGALRPGDRVNVETDILTRKSPSHGLPVTMQRLTEWGYT